MRELYDLVVDPQELHNLADEDRTLADTMTEQLEAWIAERLAAARKTVDPLREHGISLKLILEEGARP